MADKTCPECGMPEGQCYRICPTQDPYQGDQAAENADYEFNARYDDQRERYAATVEDARLSTMHPDDDPVHHCEFCGKDDTHMPEGCPCANGRALPSMTVGAVVDHKRDEQGFKLARPIPADVDPDDIPF